LWESVKEMPPKEQVSKRPLKLISQVDGLQLDASLESACKERHQRGNLMLNSQVEGQRRVQLWYLSLSFFMCKKGT
jgi:hypothetical protein